MKLIKSMLNDKSFLKKTLQLTIPVTLQNLLNNLLNLIDTLFIAQLGETEVGAVGLANKVFFVFTLLMFGFSSGAGILASQYYGKKDMLNIKRALRISLILGVSGSFLFLIPGLFFPELVMRIFTPQQEMITIGASYLVVIAISYPITAITNSHIAILRSMNYVKVPMLITTLAIGVNVVLNYGFIFGNLGLPELGAAGAAIATVIARIVELALLLFIIHKKKPGDNSVGDFIHTRYRKEEGDKTPFVNKEFISKYFSTGSAVILNEFLWGLGVTMYSLVYGRMGESATAAITMTSTADQLVMVFFFGVCSASAVILGNELGANNLHRAKELARNYIVFQVMIASIGTVLTLILRDAITSIFPASPLVEGYIRACITVLAFYIPIRALCTLFNIAILRCGGDTKAALFIDVSGVWLIGIPLAVISGLVLELPIYVVYAMVMIEEIYKMVLGYIRYRKNKWLRNII